MLILDVNKLSKNFGYGQLFANVSFSLNEGESISIVGPNGCGKSTLLKMIAGLERIDNGNVNIKKGAKVAYLDQTGSSIQDSRTVYEILKDSFGDLIAMKNVLIVCMICFCKKCQKIDIMILFRNTAHLWKNFH